MGLAMLSLASQLNRIGSYVNHSWVRPRRSPPYLQVTSCRKGLVAAVELADKGDRAVVGLHVRPEIPSLGKAFGAMLAFKRPLLGVAALVRLLWVRSRLEMPT